jgi:hypothetical protein
VLCGDTVRHELRLSHKRRLPLLNLRGDTSQTRIENFTDDQLLDTLQHFLTVGIYKLVLLLHQLSLA